MLDAECRDPEVDSLRVADVLAAERCSRSSRMSWTTAFVSTAIRSIIFAVVTQFRECAREILAGFLRQDPAEIRPASIGRREAYSATRASFLQPRNEW